MAFYRKQGSAARFAGVAACALAAVLSGAVSTPGAAQDYSRAVVQPVPPAALGELNGALRDLARNPNNLSALLRAGQASIGLDDPEAALGYFRRAEAIAPADGRVKAGLATAVVRLENPVAAVQLFAQAEARGAPMAQYAADRGLAHDLIGENVRAQQLYREALTRENDPEIVRRLALSQAIMGDQRGSEASLLPLLQRQDLAAYRTRAFALAILGKSEEAVSIAETMLPARLSNRMAAYLRYMPRLTRAQQAAAAHLGRFPRASQIGRDGPQIAAYAGTTAPQVAARTPDSRLVPAGEPLGTTGAAASAERSSGNPSTAGGELAVTYQPLPQPQASAAGSAAPPSPAVPQQTTAVIAAATPAPAPAPAPAQVQRQAEPVVVASIDSQALSTPDPASEVPRPSLSLASPAAEGAGEEVSLSEAFAAFTLVPDTTVPSARGAVDITAFEPRRERPKAEEPKPPAHPMRYWVQVATGRDVAALAFDWRRIKRSAGDLLADRDAFTAEWGQTRRLVTGPYANAGEAQKAVTALNEKGVDSFAFTSAAGEEVAPLK
jgi:Flp pilus assembly protein TadD